MAQGRGLVQARGQEVVEINPGDVVSAPDGGEHWHGATRDHFMTHLSVTEGAPHWAEHVSDAEYHAATRRTPARRHHESPELAPA